MASVTDCPNAPISSETDLLAEEGMPKVDVEASCDVFPFEKLPIEIRRMVYKELLVMPSSIYFQAWGGLPYAMKAPTEVTKEDDGVTLEDGADALEDDENIREDTYSCLFRRLPRNGIEQRDVCQLSLVSSSVYYEVVPIYFGLNTFHFPDFDEFKTFADQIGPYCRWQVASISLEMPYARAPARAAKKLATFYGLRHLRLSISPESLVTGPTGTVSELKFYGHKDILSIRGLESLEVTFHPDWYSDYLWFEYGRTWTEEETNAFIRTLDILKQPQDPKALKRHEAKDFPQKAKRTFFGGSNVMTRTERKRSGVALLEL